jgi:hypothetical protein
MVFTVCTKVRQLTLQCPVVTLRSAGSVSKLNVLPTKRISVIFRHVRKIVKGDY